jgi:ribosomal protein L3 glutamine methyltransferase
VTTKPLTFDQACNALAELLTNAQLAFGHGAPDADSEAWWILAYCVDLSPTEALEYLDETYPEDAYVHAEQIAQQRITSRQPLAYILGQAWLMGYDFICDARSIVPRSFIAEIIFDEDFENYFPPNASALDLCTGNGSLAILLALRYPDIAVTATDISSDALALASLNIEKYDLKQNIELFCGSMFTPLDSLSPTPKFDVIVCNPPYVNATSMRSLPQEFLHEPSIALAGGEDGMSIIEQLIFSAKKYLQNQGVFILEIGNERTNFLQRFPNIAVQWLQVFSGKEQVLLIKAQDLP